MKKVQSLCYTDFETMGYKIWARVKQQESCRMDMMWTGSNFFVVFMSDN